MSPDDAANLAALIAESLADVTLRVPEQEQAKLLAHTWRSNTPSARKAGKLPYQDAPARVSGEMELHALAYNLSRVMNIMGSKPAPRHALATGPASAENRLQWFAVGPSSTGA